MNPTEGRVINLLEQIWVKLGNGGSSASLNQEATQLLVLAELQRLANIEIDVDTINLNTDQLETLLAQILARQADKTQFTNITDGTDTLLINPDGSINTSIASLPLPLGSATEATLAALLTELQLKADLTETQPVSVTNFPTTQNVNLVSSVELELKNDTGNPLNVTGTLNVTGVATADNQTNGLQKTQVTDGIDTLAINADGSINTNDTKLKVIETLYGANSSVGTSQVLFSYNLDGTVNTANYIAIQNLTVETLYQAVQTGNKSLSKVIVVNNSPLIGDKTTYLGYNLQMINGNTNPPDITENAWVIKKIIERQNGNVDICFANNNTFKDGFTLVFDDGTQNYLTYSYYY